MRYDWVMRQTIEPLLPATEPNVFCYGNARGIDVETARGPPVQIVPRTVVPRVLPAPERIGRQGHQAAQAAENIIGPLRPEEGAVTAIVLDDEDPHEETGGEHRQRQRHPK